MDGSTPEDKSMNTRAILYKDLKKKISESVTFALDFSEREELYALVNLSLRQDSDNPEHAEERQDHDFNVDFRGDSRESSSSVASRRGSNDEFGEIIKQVARELHSEEDIDNLGKELEFNVPDICRFIKQNSTNGVNSRGTLNMLRTWRSGVDKSEEQSILRDALLRAGLINLQSRLLP
nr:uncharacterized protein LOC129276327 [Lytechinus pictus]